MGKYKDHNRHAQITTTTPVRSEDGRGYFPAGIKANAIIDKRSESALCMVGSTLVVLQKEDYQELTDAPIRVV